ncbi:hypothetical protein [Ekhidna sp.]|uniref:hypothetical protein n=1 Tax=Ekhidna sp. TaxID=2608089 RepID=UPI003B5C57D2
MKGYIYTMYQGADPGNGFTLTDPIYDKEVVTMGACMPNIRRFVDKNDYIFNISGRVTSLKQYVVGGFQVDKKIDALTALNDYPQNQLKKKDDGTFRGNIIIDSEGNHLDYDYHSNYEKRLDNYILGKDPIFINEEDEIKRAREETLDILKDIFQKDGDSVFGVIGRFRKMNEKQIDQLINWMDKIKLK